MSTDHHQHSIGTFLTYYKEYFQKVHNYLYYRTGRHREVADDLCSEIFLKAFEKFHQYDPSRPFRVWIYTIARNHLIDHYRSYRGEVSIDEVFGLSVDEGLAETIDKKNLAEKILKELKKINPVYREIIMLKYFGECTTEEMAEILNLSPNAVYVTLHRGLAKLRQLTKKDYGF